MRSKGCVLLHVYFLDLIVSAICKVIEETAGDVLM